MLQFKFETIYAFSHRNDDNMMKRLVLPFVLATTPAHALELQLPVTCEPGQACVIQNYVDNDTGAAWRDYRCGKASYNGHKGTDFRVRTGALSTQAARVVAVAPGKVRAIRNNQTDRLVRTPSDRKRIKGVECGNGVAIDHGAGWRTQYCHMAKGSITVRAGQTVKAGDTLGWIGQSGDTAFHHLHLAVTRNGKVVDPFRPTAQQDTCDATGSLSPTSLWSAAARKQLAYQDVTVFNLGFAQAPVTAKDLSQRVIPRPDKTSPVLLLYGHVLHLKKGDQIKLEISGPSGFAAQSTIKPVDRAKAQYVAYAGKRLKTAAWPAGTYNGKISVVRAGLVVRRATRRLEIAN